jgi:thioredoxin-like negative regulator of GroEL
MVRTMSIHQPHRREVSPADELAYVQPCLLLANRLSESAGSIYFIKVNVDDAEDVSQEYGIRAMPTFMVFKDGEKADEVVGADPSKLERLVQQFQT